MWVGRKLAELAAMLQRASAAGGAGIGTDHQAAKVKTTLGL